MRGKKPIYLKQIADEGIDIAAQQGFKVLFTAPTNIDANYARYKNIACCIQSQSLCKDAHAASLPCLQEIQVHRPCCSR